MYNHRKKNFLKDKRLFALSAIVFLAAFLIISRLFTLQIVRGERYGELALDKHSVYAKLESKRGEIYVTEFGSDARYPVATNQTLYLSYVEPSKIQNKTYTARVLAENLNLDEKIVLKNLYENIPYKVMAHNVSSEVMQKIKNYKLIGVGFEEEAKRIYPEKGFGGQILGFVGFDGNKKKGRYGLEGYFEKEIAGQSGFLQAEKDAFGRLIPWSNQKIDQAVDGTDLILTIDRGVQFYICDKIKEGVKRFQADSGEIIVMEPQTGKILAMCAYPDFDPNNYNKETNQAVFNNPSIFYQYEPGSIFKPITMAAGIDAKLVSPESTYTDEGSVYIKPHTIKNSDGKTNGVQTMTQVLEKSLNTGVVHVVKLLGSKNFKEYVEAFGFGNLTGVELDGEALGDISSLGKRGEIWSATASFGQGVAVTPLQMLNAFNVLANGGKLMRPYIVDRMIDTYGAVRETQPKALRQVISSRTSTLLRGMLASVVENGHGKRAGVPGYFVGGKTGTAQVSKKEGGGYEKNKVIGSFIGFAPADNPVFSMLVKIDQPRTVEWAESSAAPIFGEIAKFLLNYYKVPPER